MRVLASNVPSPEPPKWPILPSSEHKSTVLQCSYMVIVVIIVQHIVGASAFSGHKVLIPELETIEPCSQTAIYEGFGQLHAKFAEDHHVGGQEHCEVCLLPVVVHVVVLRVRLSQQQGQGVGIGRWLWPPGNVYNIAIVVLPDPQPLGLHFLFGQLHAPLAFVIRQMINKEFIHPDGYMVTDPLAQEMNVPVQFNLCLHRQKVGLVRRPLEILRV